jgi:hypothetical protein
MAFDPHSFNEHMIRLAEEIWSICATLGQLREGEAAAKEADDKHEIREQLYATEDTLRDALAEMLLSLRAALSCIGCEHLARELDEVMSGRRHFGKFGETQYHAGSEQDESVDLKLMRPYWNAFTNLFDIHVGVQGRRDLTSLLRQIPQILDFGKIDVKKENDVDKALFRFLQLLFDGVVDKPIVPAEVKCYKPDTGVISLRSLIEYKYIDSEKKLGEVIDQINADIPAYSRTRDWSWFYIVFYMEEKYSQIDDVFKRFEDLPYIWKFLIVMPNGEAFEHRGS